MEIVQLSLPETSYEALDGMVAHVESIVKALGLPYRILRLCGGDMSFTSALTYDFEVYSEAQKRWLEVSSVSNFESFQANRLKLRYRDEEKKIQLAHTSTARRWPCRASWPRCWRTIRPPKASAFPRR